ncbi:MAG: hypothetical protein ABJA35_13250, partial [Parafilimonas sp.]
MGYNTHQKLIDNINAIRVALEWKESDRLSSEQTEALKKYAGFGGIKAVLYPNTTKEDWIKENATDNDLKLFENIKALHDLLQQHFDEKEYKQIIDSLKNSVLTAFYTPEIIPKTIYSVLKEKGLQPENIYEPSAGAGIFVTEATKAFHFLKGITAVEKDILSGRVLTALGSSIPVPVSVQIKGFENTSSDENDKFDLIVSNIPFGSFRVYDKSFNEAALTGKIHNYFFAKGLDKIKEGGILAYITTDAFLNTSSNQAAREYLFNNADFVSLTVMPDNLMKDTGNTEAPSHLLMVQKNTNKDALSDEEQLLINTVEQENVFGKYNINQYIQQHPDVITADEIKPGKDQYGKSHQTVWQDGDINAIAKKLGSVLFNDIGKRVNRNAFALSAAQKQIDSRAQLTFKPAPEYKNENISVQLGLFDAAPAENINRAMAYINALDETTIEKNTARLVNKIKASDKPEQEAFVLITAKSKLFKQYVYKLYSNAVEINFASNWQNASAISNELNSLSEKLRGYNHDFFIEGESGFHFSFGSEDEKLDELTDINSLYKEGTLVIHKGSVGFVSYSASENDRAVFLPSLNDKKDLIFYQQYIGLRDGYLNLNERENIFNNNHQYQRERLHDAYNNFIAQHGNLNSQANRHRILKDEAFGAIILASLERKDGGQFIKADVLTQTLIENKQAFVTDDPIEALARSLNDTGKVDIEFITAATRLTGNKAIESLGSHIYLDPATNDWQTADQFLSGNVVAKLITAKDEAEKNPANAQFQRSFEALEKVQPEIIPFELLDFNLGERWIPQDYYNRFASHLFELDTEVNYFPSVDSFKVKVQGSNAKINQEYAIITKAGKTSYGNTLLENALENTTPFYTYEITRGDKTVRVPDNDAIQLAHQKIE